MRTLFSALLLVACTKLNVGGVKTNATPPLGDADAYQGGSIVELALNAARESIVSGLRSLQGRTDPDYLCRPAFCADVASKNCQVMKNLTNPQSDFCRDFVEKNLATLMEFAPVDGPIKFRVTETPLTVPAGEGSREVEAKTEPGPQGEVVFNGPKVREFTASELVALVMHELGHKLERDGVSITDENPTGPFPNGRVFLDVVGAAVAAYIESHRSPVVYQGATRLYRLYNSNAKYYFFTAAEAERNFLVSVGVEDKSEPMPLMVYLYPQFAMVPVFRLYHPNVGNHVFTTDPEERKSREAVGYNFERVEGYVFGRKIQDFKEVFRLDNIQNGSVYLTTSSADRDALLTQFPAIWKAGKTFGFGP